MVSVEISLAVNLSLLSGYTLRRTKEEVGRQHQGMNWPGNQQVPEGSGEQGKMEKTGCKIICGAQTTLAIKSDAVKGC